MSHSSHGGMAMALPALPEFPKFYYAVVGSAVAVATLVNVYNILLYRQRLSEVKAKMASPAKPKSLFPLCNATLFALTREAANFSIQLPLKNRFIRLPTVGRTSLVLANVVVLLVLCFYGLNLTDQFSKESVGFRCGVVSIGQLPLIFLLSGKNNIVGYFVGISYERINWLHRWAARCMLLTATIHMGYFFSGTCYDVEFLCLVLYSHYNSMGPIRLHWFPAQAEQAGVARFGSVVCPSVDQLQLLNTYSRVELRAFRCSTCRLVRATHQFHICPCTTRAAGLCVGCCSLFLLRSRDQGDTIPVRQHIDLPSVAQPRWTVGL